MVATVGDVGVLLRVARTESRDAIAGGIEQSEVAGRRGEFEVGVELAVDVGVASGGEDNQVAVGGQQGGRKYPLGGLGRIVGQRPTVQADGRASAVVEFDPVGAVPEFIVQGIALFAAVGSHEFGNHYALQRRVGVKRVGPTAAGKSIGGAAQVMNAMTRRPGDLHRAGRGLGKAENKLRGRHCGKVRRRLAIDQ